MAQAISNTQPEPYKDVAWKGTWRQRSAGVWACGAIGIVAGALIGLAAPLFPAVVGAITFAEAGGMMASSAAIFAAVGLSAGIVGGGLVGASSGGVAAIAEEQEKRDKAQLKAMGVELPAVAQQQAPQESAFKKYVNPRAALIYTLLGCVAGGVFAAGAVAAGATGMASALPGIGAVLTAAGAKAALATAAYCTGVMGCFGALFGVSFGAITNDAKNVTGDLFVKRFEDEGHAPQPQLQQAIQPAVPVVAVIADTQPEQTSPARSHAEQHASRSTQGYKEMVANRASETPGLQLITR